MRLVLLWFLSLSVALAGTPVLYTGTPDSALAVVKKDRRSRGLSLEPLRLSELAPGLAPYVVGGPRRLPCLVRPMAQVAADVAQAETLFAAPGEAEALLERARLSLECMEERIDPEVAGRLFNQLGLLKWRAGQESTAEGLFTRAFFFNPSLRWDPNVGGPRAPSCFAGAQVRLLSPARGTLRLVPPTAQGLRVEVNGHGEALTDGAIRVRPGLHLVQIFSPDAPPWTLVVPVNQDEEVGVVVPISLSEAMLGQIEQAGVRSGLSMLLRARSTTDPAYVVAGASRWRYDPVANTWEALPAD